MRINKLAAAAAVALAGLVPATAQAHTVLLGKTPEARTAWLSSCGERFIPKDYERYARAVYERERVSKRAHRRLAAMHVCQPNFAARKRVGKMHRRFKAAREERQRRAAQVNALLPYPGPNGTRWAIPWHIVACESGGDWTAVNASSGALGAYQFLGWSVPWPVRTEADKMAHHRQAAALWQGGAGASHWAQCL